MGKSSGLSTKVVVILILAGIIAVLYINESHIRRYLDAFTSQAPKENLEKAHIALENNDIKGSIEAIDLAIESLSFVEEYTDSISSAYIEKAIAEMRNLEVEIQKDEIVFEDYKHAYFEAYSSMAYANLRLSELEFQEGSKEKAYEHFNNCFSYLKSALKYVAKPKLEKEQKLIDEVNQIMKAMVAHEDLENFDFNEMNNEMENLMK